MDQIFVQNRDFCTPPALDATLPLTLIVLSYWVWVDRGIQLATEMLPLKRRRGVAHTFNCNPRLSYRPMRLADALIIIIIVIVIVIVTNHLHTSSFPWRSAVMWRVSSAFSSFSMTSGILSTPCRNRSMDVNSCCVVRRIWCLGTTTTLSSWVALRSCSRSCIWQFKH